MNRKRITWSVLTFCVGLIFLNFLQADSRVEIYNLRYHTHPNFTRVVVDVGKLREYSPHQLSSPDRLYVDIYQVKLNPLLHGKEIIINNQYIHQIRIAQKSPTTVRAVVELDLEKVKSYDIFHLTDPFRIVIDIYPYSKFYTPSQPTEAGYSLARQLGLGIQKIVIDPGHGGKDPGCIGRRGVQEKDVVLDVCHRLKKLIESKKGLEVVLTRESDIFIPLEERTVIANQKRADIFISVHANSFPSSQRSGVETFYLNFTQDPSVIKTAARENATSTKNIGEMMDIIKKIVQNSKIVESKELAQKIQTNLCQSLSQEYNGAENLGVKGGPFWVLIGGQMPSILIEISHLSNPMEEKRLNTESYRQKVAEGIFRGIIDYINSLGKG